MPPAAPPSPVTPLDLDPTRALFDGEIEGLVAACYINERPAGGLAGMLDWHLLGAISRGLRSGVITGQEGECVYLPVTRHGRTFHVVLLGAGYSQAPGQRQKPASEALIRLRNNLLKLKLAKVGISRGDFGGANDEFFQRHFKGVPLWIVH